MSPKDYVTISAAEFKWITKTIIKPAYYKKILWGFLGASSRTLVDISQVIYFIHFTKDLWNFFLLLWMTKCNLSTVLLSVTLLSLHFGVGVHGGFLQNSHWQVTWYSLYLLTSLRIFGTFFSLLQITKCNLCTVLLTVTLLSPHFDEFYVSI